MSNFIALSGLNAAQANLTTTSNNIANVNTIGFHSSRAEFADIFTRSPYVAADTESGSGVRVHNIRQSFTQGSVTQTSNTLDLSLQGQGFFTLADESADGNLGYTRAGAFGVDADGYLVNAGGAYLQGFGTNVDGSLSEQINIDRINIPQTYGDAQQTTEVDLAVNLPMGANSSGNQDAIPPSGTFNYNDDTTFAYQAAINVLDEDGNAVEAQVYFIQTAEPSGTSTTSTYEMRMVVDEDVMTTTPTSAASITFDEYGNPTADIPSMSFAGTDWTLELDLTDTQMTDEAYSVQSSADNGSRPRGLAGLEVTDDGAVWATYAGDQAIALGRLAIANFPNVNGLKQIGEATYAATVSSGEAVIGNAGEGGLGVIESGALELSNVDLTSELVDLITAQRHYQASAKALETSQSMSQTIMNLRT